MKVDKSAYRAIVGHLADICGASIEIHDVQVSCAINRDLTGSVNPVAMVVTMPAVLIREMLFAGLAWET
jgi:hypothetical protein